MGDKNYMLLLLLVVIVAAGAAIYYFVLSKGNDIRNIDPATQERPKSSTASAIPTVAKTAQLSALRERLADAQTSTTGLKKMPTKPSEPVRASEAEKSWRPEDSGLGEPPSIVSDPVVPRQLSIKSGGARPQENAPAPLVAKVIVAPVAPVAPVARIRPAPAPVSAPATANPLLSVPPLADAVQVVEVALPPVLGPLPATGKVHILLVDDSKVVRVKTEKLLLNKGYIVTTAVDGIDALAKLETLRPAIIITDIEMPNLDGFGLVRNVRGNLRTSEIPVIVMTSHVNLHLDIAATEGINGFLPKPFNDQDLLDQVAFLCES